jgi:transposase
MPRKSFYERDGWDEKLELIEGWARDGLTDEQIAHNMGIGVGTIYRYKKRYPKFFKAIKKGKSKQKQIVNNLIKKSLSKSEIKNKHLFFYNCQKENKMWENKNNKITEDIFLRLKSEPNFIFEGREEDLEVFYNNNISKICKKIGLPKVKKILSQKSIKLNGKYIRPDLLVIHENGEKTVFEVKCSNAKNNNTSATEQCKGLGQLMLYNSYIKEMSGERPNLFLISDKIYERTVMAFSDFDLPVTLMEVQKNIIFIPYKNN